MLQIVFLLQLLFVLLCSFLQKATDVNIFSPLFLALASLHSLPFYKVLHIIIAIVNFQNVEKGRYKRGQHHRKTAFSQRLEARKAGQSYLKRNSRTVP